MSKNNAIRKSDKKFIRLEKARIRMRFSDLKKQEEAVAELYKRFIKTPVAVEKPKKEEKKPAVKKVKVKA